MKPAIIFRECIAATGGHYPKGLIMIWPADMELPTGMIWLREKAFIAGAGGEPIEVWGDFTPEALKIMEEMSK